jgi:tripartite-type tricarboxylate transporter receptor subunit TctC
MIARISCWLLAATLLSMGPAAAQQAWPERFVRIVSAYAAGGSSDIVLRAVAQRMTEALGQQVIVENRPGAGTLLATESVARARPDGYTLLMTGSSAFAIAPHLQPTMPFRTEDLQPVTMLYQIPLAVYFNPRMVPARNLAEFVTYARAHPGALSFGTTGRGNAGHLIGEMLKAAAGIDMVDVHYRGSGSMVQDVLGDRLPVMTEALVGHLGNVRAGRYAVLGVSSETRLPFAPDVPTFAEQGYPQMTTGSWLALFAPAGTPAPIVARVNAVVRAALEDRALADRLGEEGAILGASTPAELAARIASDHAQFGEIIRRIGLKLD